MVIFSTKQVSTKDLGEYLAECRSQLGMSLPEAAKLSQIQPKYILAFEEGRFHDLPAEVYAIGFLKKLASLYAADGADIVSQYRSERGIMENLAVINEPKKKNDFSFTGFVLSPKILTIAGIAALALSSLVYLYFQVNSLHRPPPLEIALPAEDGTVSSSLMLVTGKTEPGSSVFLNNQEIVVDSAGNFRENLTLGSGTNQLVIRSVNKFSKESVVTRSVVFTEKEIAGISTAENAEAHPFTAGAELNLTIGPEAAWIRVEADGREEYAGTMLKGATRQFQAQNKIVVTTGNAGSTRVTWNGKDLGVLGKEGEVIRDIEFAR